MQVLALNYETAEDNRNYTAMLEELTAKLAKDADYKVEVEEAKEKQKCHQEASRRGLVVRGVGFALVVIGILLFGVFISMNT